MNAHRGFTLVELLMVMAIIGLLASVIMGSLREARFKASDASVRQQAIQLRNIMELERSESGNYAKIKAGSSIWFTEGQTCTLSAFTTSPYAVEATAVCDALIAASGSTCSTNCATFRTTNPSHTDRFSIMAYLPGASFEAGTAKYLCLGSSGRQSITDFNDWTPAGCYSNP